MDPVRSTSETGVVVIQVIPSLYVDHPTLILLQWQSCASMSCPPAARHSEVIDPLLMWRGGKKNKCLWFVYLRCIPTVVQQQIGRQRDARRGGREGGKRGLRLLLGKKMMRRLFLEPADRRREREGKRRGGGGVDLLNPRWVMWVSRFLTHPAIFSGSTASSIL